MPNIHLLRGGLELWVALRTFMYLNAAALIQSYFTSQTTKGCYCQQIGEGGVSPGAMLNMQPTYDQEETHMQNCNPT